MCGIIALLLKEQAGYEAQREYALKISNEMLLDLKYRGPDERSIAELGNVILGHTRLSIIDLDTGSQPIFNEDETIAVILNGEIYNYRELRKNLQSRGHVFRSQSDTEVIVHLYEEHGENLFSLLNGMFAIVIYDNQKKVMLAARDRMGEKPLIYCNQPDMFLISSELKTLLRHRNLKKEIDQNALSLYLNCMYIPSPLSIFTDIQKLPPAHFLKIHDGSISIKKYWNPEPVINWAMTENEIEEEFIELFADAVKIRTVSDVPIGVFLSGGIDSSAVTAFMALACEKPIKTFTVGFADEIDERPFAKIVSDRYHTEHTEIYVQDKIEEVLEGVIGYFDEPFGDSSAIPTYLVAKEARNYVKVILTGDGGDELFAGYNSYIDQKYILKGRLSTFLFKKLNQFSINLFQSGIFERFYPHFSNEMALKHWLWVRTIFTDSNIQKIMRAPTGDSKLFFKDNRWFLYNNSDPLSVAFAHDLNYYLPDDLLKKVDMASMLASLECRAPFLDHRLVEFSLKIPPNLKVKNDRLKHILKNALKNYLSDVILNRPKTGFGAPVGSWLRNQLKGMVNDLLCKNAKLESILDKKSIHEVLSSVYSSDNTKNYRNDFQLWLLLVLEIWMRKYL